MHLYQPFYRWKHFSMPLYILKSFSIANALVMAAEVTEMSTERRLHFFGRYFHYQFFSCEFEILVLISLHFDDYIEESLQTFKSGVATSTKVLRDYHTIKNVCKLLFCAIARPQTQIRNPNVYSAVLIYFFLTSRCLWFILPLLQKQKRLKKFFVKPLWERFRSVIAFSRWCKRGHVLWHLFEVCEEVVGIKKKRNVEVFPRKLQALLNQVLRPEVTCPFV